MLQYLAQGACMAVEDAVCLADRMAVSNGDYASAFVAYQNARYLRTGRVQIMARIYGEVYHAAASRANPQHDAGDRTPEQALNRCSGCMASRRGE